MTVWQILKQFMVMLADVMPTAADEMVTVAHVCHVNVLEDSPMYSSSQSTLMHCVDPLSLFLNN